ncbi:MAG: hypothetical protein ABI557_16005 [Aureliella sp.]
MHLLIATHCLSDSIPLDSVTVTADESLIPMRTTEYELALTQVTCFCTVLLTTEREIRRFRNI